MDRVLCKESKDKIKKLGFLVGAFFGCAFLVCTGHQKPLYAYTDEQIVNAIYIAEGGPKTKHPYGILTHYKTTTPRQACFNTVRHARTDWNGEGDFIAFLGSRYCPVGAKNDPTGLNKNWVRNVNSILRRKYDGQRND